MKTPAKTTARDMTEGSIVKHILMFALPLMFGNIFQMLYNTADSVVVGQFVSTEALAAVGSTTSIVNIMVFFFNGFSIGAGVVIGQYFGAKNMDKLHDAIETTMATTFICCVLFTVLGYFMVGPMLNLMATPEDVFDDATLYLHIYFLGLSGLLVYNMGSGILRAVGDTTRPLYFLIFTSLLNIALDLLFVLVFQLGIAGVALATIAAQFISAVLVMLLLTKTNDIYKLTWKDLRIHGKTLIQILKIGLPTAIQSVITAFSNVFVQSYINFFGSDCMAGWSCYNKLDSFIMLPMSSVAMAATTFVSQNVGAKNVKRANEGTKKAIIISLSITFGIAMLVWIFAEPCVSMFSSDAPVIEYGALFVHYLIFFMLFNCVNHVLAGALRGRGDSTGPMVIMLIGFVAIRQIYLYVVTHYIVNAAVVVGMGYPVGWFVTCVLEVIYFKVRWNRKRTVGIEE